MRNKANLTLCIFTVFGFWNIYAQDGIYRKYGSSLGVKLGLGVSSFTNSLTIDGESIANVSANGGIAFFLPIKHNHFSLQSEFTYNIRTFKDENSLTGDLTYLISTIELPVILNTRLFNYTWCSDGMVLNMFTGLGICKGLKSRVLEDGSNILADYGFMEEHRYIQINAAFEDIRKTNIFFVIGVNTHTSKKNKGLIGLRFTKYIKSIYALNKEVDIYDFTTKMYCLSLETTFFF